MVATRRGSEWVCGAGQLAGRTCPGEAFGRPFHVLLAAVEEVDLTAGRPFAGPDIPSPDQAACPPHSPSATLLPSFTNKEKNKLFLFPSNT